jgi:hypothetical protein
VAQHRYSRNLGDCTKTVIAYEGAKTEADASVLKVENSGLVRSPQHRDVR